MIRNFAARVQGWAKKAGKKQALTFVKRSIAVKKYSLSNFIVEFGALQILICLGSASARGCLWFSIRPVLPALMGVRSMHATAGNVMKLKKCRKYSTVGLFRG